MVDAVEEALDVDVDAVWVWLGWPAVCGIDRPRR
jgi:hypothetical protein